MKLIWLAPLLVCSILALASQPAGDLVIRTAAGPKAVKELTWSDCGVAGSPKYFEIGSLKVEGDIVSGNSISASGAGTVTRAFTVSSLDVSVQLGFLKLYSSKFPLKEPSTFALGKQTFNLDPKLPITPVNGTYKITARMRDPAGKELQCFLVAFKIA